MVVLSVLFGVASGLALRAHTKASPVAKVVKLLDDMKAQLVKEQTDDEEVYEKLSCWCTTNEKEKSTAISAAEAKVAALESAIKEYAGQAASLETKIQKAKDEYNAEFASLTTQTELRMKERKQFSEEEKDMLATVDACEQAIAVLSKHHPELVEVKATVRTLRHVQRQLLAKAPQEAKAALVNFLNAGSVEKAVSFLTLPVHSSQSSQSGQIFGILKQMKEDFEANLSEAQKEERRARKEFAELKAAKEQQMAALRKQQQNFESDLADTMEKKAAAEEDLADTTEQLTNDQQFLLNLRKRCKETDEEYNARVKSRHEEIEAVTETIEILNNDNSFDSLNKSFGFMQLNSLYQAREAKIGEVVTLLRPLAEKDPRLGLISMSAQLNAFTKVKEAIDQMVAQLQAEGKDEVAHRDWCIAQFNENEANTEEKNDEKTNLETTIENLRVQIENLTKDLDDLNSAIKEMKTEMTRAGDNRAKENADFQEAVQDQRVTQAILLKARNRMAQKYGFVQQPGAAHTELSGTKTDPGSGPARFNKYEVSQSGNKIIGLLDKVMNDSKAVENQAIIDERDSQIAYEGFMKDSNKNIAAKQKAVVNKTEEKAVASQSKTTAEDDLAQNAAALEGLRKYHGELKGSCDFVLKNFDGRQEARQQEVKALRQAKDILSGMQ